MELIHVRRRLARKAWGTGRPLRLQERQSSTFCGAPCGLFDVAWADRNRVRPWTDPEGLELIPCSACRDKVKSEEA